MSAVWFVYYLRCADNSLYCGITTDLTRRLDEHNNHPSLGAKFTKARRPVKLVYYEEQPDRSSASQKEYQLKKLHKKYKEQIVDSFDAINPFD